MGRIIPGIIQPTSDFFNCSTDIWVFPFFPRAHSPTTSARQSSRANGPRRIWSGCGGCQSNLSWFLLVSFEMRSLASSINFQHWWAIVGEWHHCTSAWAMKVSFLPNVHKSWRTERLGSEVVREQHMNGLFRWVSVHCLSTMEDICKWETKLPSLCHHYLPPGCLSSPSSYLLHIFFISSGWWFQPIWKICSSNWVHLPQIRAEN